MVFQVYAIDRNSCYSDFNRISTLLQTIIRLLHVHAWILYWYEMKVRMSFIPAKFIRPSTTARMPRYRLICSGFDYNITLTPNINEWLSRWTRYKQKCCSRPSYHVQEGRFIPSGKFPLREQDWRWGPRAKANTYQTVHMAKRRREGELMSEI